MAHLSIRTWLLAAVLVILGSVLITEPAEAIENKRDGTPARNLVKPPSAFVDACRRYAWLCEKGGAKGQSVEPQGLLDRAQEINTRVNRSVTHLSDAEHYGSSDYWALPSRGRGDCEDYVLRKYQLLLEAGIDSRHFSVAIARTHGQNHAVLILHHPYVDLVLDSLRNTILPWNKTGYRFLAMQTRDDKRTWEVVAYQPRDNVVLAQR